MFSNNYYSRIFATLILLTQYIMFLLRLNEIMFFERLWRNFKETKKLRIKQTDEKIIRTFYVYSSYFTCDSSQYKNFRRCGRYLIRSYSSILIRFTFTAIVTFLSNSLGGEVLLMINDGIKKLIECVKLSMPYR